ncbi:MAG: family 78 glycoside hydrolase catalytic domain, partial [Bacteroidota bacterium]|nr:family 78 glycoside hydrolase catalytic domain [Bacteroidota bacterium]
MKNTRRSILFLFVLLLFQVKGFSAPVHISSVMCEHKVEPLGVPLKNIHFEWMLQSDERNVAQSAYQLTIATTKENLLAGKYDVWNSGVVKSSQSILVPYLGTIMKPGEKYFWRVKVWDQKNQGSEWSEISSFVTGLFSSADWSNAQWIGYEDMPESERLVPGVHAPEAGSVGEKCQKRPVVPMFRKEFILKKKVARAVAFVSGLGQYEMSINGKKVGNSFLAPGWTFYDKKCLYNTYNVTQYLKDGGNAIGVIVGNGFYNINRERYFKLTVAFGMPKMICKLKILYTDGTTATIVSDQSWKTAPSPITFASIYGGEDYDARMEQPGWDKPAFNDLKWKKVLLVTRPKGVLMPESDNPVKPSEIINLKAITRPKNNVYLYDYGQNASGILTLKVKGKKGQVVKLIPAELITPDHLANQNATGTPNYLSYTLKGEGVETWTPRFTYTGFRYVQVEGAVPEAETAASDLPRIQSLSFIHTHNSAPVSGSFTCSNELFNRINTLIKWAIKSNMQSVMTDCPHREKLGWLEQDYLMGTSIHFNYDLFLIYKKIVDDMIEAQAPDGLIPDIAPEYVTFGGGFRDSPEWGSAGVILPWMIYSWYGDKEVVAKAYPMMKKYVAYLESKSDKHVLSYGLGDWCDYGPNAPGESQLTPKALTATAIYYYDVILLQKMALVLEDSQEAARLGELAEQIKTAFNQKFYNTQTKVYATGSQTAMAMPWCVGLVDQNDKDRVMQNLEDSIRTNNKALTAGDVGFYFLVEALTKGGKSQLLYEMNARDDVPGYGFQLKKGATALTESWPALEEVSNNHLMLG